MIHGLLVLAAILLVLWFIFQGVGGAIQLLWLVIIALVVIWAFGFFRGRTARS